MFFSQVNAVNYAGNTPLHTAAGLGKKEFVIALMAGGADPTLANGEGDTAKDICRDKEVSVVFRIRRNSSTSVVLLRAAYSSTCARLYCQINIIITSLWMTTCFCGCKIGCIPGFS